MNKKKIQTAAFFLIIALIITILPAGMSQIKMIQAELPFTGSLDFTNAGVAPHGPHSVLKFLYVAAVILILAGLVFAVLTGGIKRLLIWSLVLLAIYLFFKFRGQSTKQPPKLQNPVLDVGKKVKPMLKIQPPEPSNWLSWLVGFLVCAAILIAGLVIWKQLKKRLTPMQEVVREVEKSLVEIRKGAELKSVIMQCYHDMMKVLAERHQLNRSGSMTPREFEYYLRETGFLTEDVSRLTGMFERVRYGSKALGPDEEKKAVQSLESFIQFCDNAK